MNKVILIGRITKDPDIKFASGSGNAVTTFSLAVDRTFSKDGQKEADFLNIVCFKKTAEFVANNLGKGRLIAVSGSLRTSNYVAQDGHKVYKTDIYADEIKVLEWPKDGQAPREASHTDTAQPQNNFFPVEDDDIPF